MKTYATCVTGKAAYVFTPEYQDTPIAEIEFKTEIIYVIINGSLMNLKYKCNFIGTSLIINDSENANEYKLNCSGLFYRKSNFSSKSGELISVRTPFFGLSISGVGKEKHSLIGHMQMKTTWFYKSEVELSSFDLLGIMLIHWRWYNKTS